MSWDGTSAPALFFTLPDGRDTLDSFVDDTAASLYYDRASCGREFKADILQEPLT